MTSVVRKSFAAFAGIASLISGAFWHLSADAQVKALKLSGEAADVLTLVSAQHNLYAAICAVVAGVILAALAGTD